MNQEVQAIALMLGLSAEATLTDVQKQVRILLEFKNANERLRNEVKDLKDQLDTIQLSGITAMVDEAIKGGKFTADKKDHFVELGKKVGAESLKMTIDAMRVSMKPSTILGKGTGAAPKEYKSWGEVPEAELKLMRDENKELYRKLYKAEFGTDCEI